VTVKPGVSWDMVNLIIHRSLLRGMHGHSAKSCSGIKTNA
jgi:hypothetical protein